MRHARFDVATLAIEGVEVGLRTASLLVAEADDAEHPHWECVAYAVESAPIAQGRYHVAVTSLEGRRFEGDAILVRSVDGAHVLRGDGRLHGIAVDDLA